MTMDSTTLAPALARRMHAYWRAANYLSVGQIYLADNPLLKRPLEATDIKPMLLGHWGTTPGQNFIYVHLNRVIKEFDLNMIYVSGPGHGGPAVVGNTYLEGTYSEVYPNISQDEAGLQKLFLQFSFPGGIPSHASPECPGSIHEGGELGYSLSHAFGAVFDNPDLIVACVIGDGEAETGPLATAWHSNKFLDPATDGAVLPILHLNGYKIANPTVLARIDHEELDQLLRGYGWTPIFVEGDEPALMHEAMAKALDVAVEQIQKFQTGARAHGQTDCREGVGQSSEASGRPPQEASDEEVEPMPRSDHPNLEGFSLKDPAFASDPKLAKLRKGLIASMVGFGLSMTGGLIGLMLLIPLAMEGATWALIGAVGLGLFVAVSVVGFVGYSVAVNLGLRRHYEKTFAGLSDPSKAADVLKDLRPPE